MSGLREAFDEIVADVPVYGDLDRAIEQADRERRRRNGAVAGLAAAAAVVAVIVGVLAVTRDGNDSPQPIGPSPTPTETRADTTPETTAPVNLPANGHLARAEDLFARALEPCSIITADYELATPGADCVIWAHDVDAAAGIGLFEENPTDTGNDPNGPAFVTTLRVATQDGVIGQFPSPYEGVDAELGPGPDEISLPHGREITVVGFDGSERRSIDLSAVLVPPEGDRIGEEIRSLEWSPDGTRVAVVSRLHSAEGMSSQIWIVDRDGGQPQLVHTATNTEPVPANNTPLAYIWSVAWSPDGGSLGFIEEFAYIGGTEVAQSRRAAILTLSGSGAAVPRTLYDYPSSTVFDEAEILWSPDGARVALRVPDQVLELSADGRADPGPAPPDRRKADLAREGEMRTTPRSRARGTSILLACVAWMLVANLAGCGGGSESGGSPAAPSTPPSASLRTIPEWDAEDGNAVAAFEAGTYLIPSSAWSVADFTVTFPKGGRRSTAMSIAQHRAGDEFGFYAVVVDEIYADSVPGERDPRAVGPGVRGPGHALREQAGGAEAANR